MSQHIFTLYPFRQSVPIPPFALTGAISRTGTRLAITYELAGPLQELIIEPPAPVPARQWVLWETTCCEFFVAVPGVAVYWEFNLSPAGHWNLFRLTDYRQGIQEEPAMPNLPFNVNRHPGKLTLTLNVDLAPLIRPDTTLEVAVSTILQHHDGHLSYWALTHPAPEPDFHHRASFVIKL